MLRKDEDCFLYTRAAAPGVFSSALEVAPAARVVWLLMIGVILVYAVARVIVFICMCLYARAVLRCC